jgi:hypothetical protein
MGSKWHVIGASVRDVIGVFSRVLGAIELANRFRTNEPGPHVPRLGARLAVELIQNRSGVGSMVFGFVSLTI